MERILRGLEPEAVFRNFEDLTRIPRGSGNEKQVSDFLVQFAKSHGLEVIQDSVYNVIIKKPATLGYEKSKRVILQGHMDMVLLKEEDSIFDFEKDPIPIYVEGDYIKTKGTTLGADNGIALAMIMAILESKTLEHPPLTALFTVSEETGMDGVVHLNPKQIAGDILINLDSEEEGIFWVSCAGGVNNIVSLPIQWEKALNDREFYEITIGGLLGGHSGTEINKNRASAIKLLGRLLQDLEEKVGMDLSFVEAGEKMNAIPQRAKAIISIEEDKKDALKKEVEKAQKIFQNEYRTSEPNLFIKIKEAPKQEKIFNKDTKRHFIAILRLLPFGVQTMSADIEGLVESSNNIGVIEIKENTIYFDNAIRSSVKSLKEEINQRIQWICQLTGASMKLEGDYPEWQYKKQSPIRELMQKVYQEMYQRPARVEALHAGLECGFLKEKIGDIDMISIGPNMYDVHTPHEHLSISSTKRVFEFLCEVLRRLK
ncbi:aminoacyl-histidine dipeptidase [Garciella nitratireducens]|uniref:aminoacyl-histidine dipeptidase n=1 Tax=Garciella nitratireducens TaxID=218205 RepID=UPI000DEA07DA|nr:dipeptidase D [Garciella nitratireducens]